MSTYTEQIIVSEGIARGIATHFEDESGRGCYSVENHDEGITQWFDYAGPDKRDRARARFEHYLTSHFQDYRLAD